MASSPTNKGLPPTVLKKESGGLASSNAVAVPGRKDSLGCWAGDDFLGMISHTPPALSPGSLTLPVQKRNRSGSISSRLLKLSGSDLQEKGLIDRHQKGVIKVR